jgi:hypothetical protein
MPVKSKRSMTRICLNLSEETARRLRETALKKTGSMKGLSEVGEEALNEYLEKNYPRRIRIVAPRRKISDEENQALAETEQIQQTGPT